MTIKKNFSHLLKKTQKIEKIKELKTAIRACQKTLKAVDLKAIKKILSKEETEQLENILIAFSEKIRGKMWELSQITGDVSDTIWNGEVPLVAVD